MDKSREFERGLSIQKIIDNSVPVREIVRATGSIKPIAQALDIALTKLVQSININQNLNDSQIKVIVEDLLDKYPNESLEDFILCFKKARQGEFGIIYHLHSAVIFGWMSGIKDEHGNVKQAGYLDEKYEALVRKLEREKENMYARPENKPAKTELDVYQYWMEHNNLKEGIRPVPQISDESVLSEGQSEPPKKKGTSWPVSTPDKQAEIQAKIELGRKIHELGKSHPGKTLDELKAMVEKGIV